MRKNLSCRFGVAGCLALALVWAMLALSGGALADPPPHNHGGDDGDEETVLFDVTTLVGSDIEIIGVFDGDFDPGLPDDDIITTPTGCIVQLGPAAGGTNTIQTRVIVSQPYPAIQMDFLAEGPDGLSCFIAGDIYGLNCGILLSISQKKNGSAMIGYFFEARGTDGQVRDYKVDGDAIIVADEDPDGICGDGSFPTGACGYTVFVDNLRVSRNTGSGQTACQGSFPDAMAVIRLDRIIP